MVIIHKPHRNHHRFVSFLTCGSFYYPHLNLYTGTSHCPRSHRIRPSSLELDLKTRIGLYYIIKVNSYKSPIIGDYHYLLSTHNT